MASSQSTLSAPGQAYNPKNPTVNPEKVMISGDDILIEYAERLVSHLKKISEVQLKAQHKTAILKFIAHYVWH